MTDVFVIAGTPREAAAMKTPGAAFLAGGTEINRLGSMVKADRLISVGKLSELQGISARDGRILIGSGCTFQEVLESGLTPGYMKEACLFMGSRTKRNMATVGGNIAMCRDDSYLLPTLLACGAELVLLDGKGQEKRLPLAAYTGNRECHEQELILTVLVPERLDFAASHRHANTVESNARLTVSLAVDGGRYTVAAAVKKAGLYLFDDLAGKLAADPDMSEEELIAWARSGVLPIEDDKVYGGADYRRYLLGASIARLLRDYGRGGRP